MEKMKQTILLVNPPIYDFAAYDFWLKPLGMLTTAGHCKPFAHIDLFDYLDRLSPDMPPPKRPPKNRFRKGPFHAQHIPRPPEFAHIPRYFRRFGIPRRVFQDYLRSRPQYDFVLIQTTMTYWYPGLKEVIEDVRTLQPRATIVLGGFYATLLPDHARSLGADLIIEADNHKPLYDKLLATPADYHPPYWQAYPNLRTAAMTLTTGCPYKCTYCAIGQMNLPFAHRPIDHCIQDLQLLLSKGVTDIAFYDDALLYKPEKILKPFLEYVIGNIPQGKINFHTPNAMHARYITPEIAQLMVRAGFRTFYLGFESASPTFQQNTGSKVVSADLAAAVTHLKNAGADAQTITAYELIGHPNTDLQHLESSIRFANSLGIKVMLSDFSPIPNTPDGQLCSEYIDLSEPLNHNKTAFPITLLGHDKVSYYKNLCKSLNRSLPAPRSA
ncbi:B12-binding domain/radical SAM domain protein, family [Anaerohalosphaera lusitana]|uniref:B12-binding domain/radical SAM domain protein, family n=1 Tax=Anaerohalosphaera lusitana TaxID=1936003 RepID=A0A1U9NJQ3_9BACT|nr:B12-binding domain-containing radical SAM protein [Anaerohalosphaera lusitana]AQT68037.1 B12-binding domain/radical SAM domain protein, family [Anaerohalosphaera lusitana]